jgi:hypothetical protein
MIPKNRPARPARGPAPRHAGRARGPAALALGRELRGAVPHQLLRAPRCRHRGAALRQRGRRLRLQPLLQPHVTMMERRLAALEGTAAASARPAAWRHPAAHHGLLKAGDHVVCSRSVFGSTIKLLPGVRQVRRRDQLRLADRRGRVARRDAAEHEAAVRRDAHQPADRGLRHPRAGRHRARRRRAAGGGQLLLLARRCSSR